MRYIAPYSLNDFLQGSPVCVKRIRLDVTESNPRRVHFNDNPVSESVEIPRTPKQQFTRKKLQMSALAEADDKDEEMEGVTSLVMYPDLVDNPVGFHIYINKVAVCVFVCCSPRTFSFTIVMITQVLVQTFTTRGKQQLTQSATFVSRLPKF